MFAKDVVLTNHRTAFLDPDDSESDTWLLLHVRPLHPGRFVFRSEFLQGKRTTVTQEYDIVVADASVRRTHELRGGEAFPLPLLCMGDELVVPFILPKRTTPRFYRTPADARIAQIWFEYQERGWENARPKFDFPVDYPAAAHFKVLSSGAADIITADGRRYANAQLGLFLEAREAGRFDLAVNVNGHSANTTVPIVIVPKDQPLTILATDCNHEEAQAGKGSGSWRDQHELKTLVVRVGDKVMLPSNSFGGRSGDTKASTVFSPQIKLEERPFVPKPGSFGFIGDTPVQVRP